MRAAGRRTFRAYRSTVGSPEQAAAYQNGARQAWKNSRTEVSAVRVFEIGGMMIESMAIRFFRGTSKKTETVDDQLLPNYLFSANRPPTILALTDEHIETLAIKEYAQ